MESENVCPNPFLTYILKAIFVLLAWGVLDLGPSLLVPFYGGKARNRSYVA
jgi:hypothetical protein